MSYYQKTGLIESFHCFLLARHVTKLTIVANVANSRWTQIWTFYFKDAETKAEPYLNTGVWNVTPGVVTQDDSTIVATPCYHANIG